MAKEHKNPAWTVTCECRFSTREFPALGCNESNLHLRSRILLKNELYMFLKFTVRFLYSSVVLGEDWV